MQYIIFTLNQEEKCILEISDSLRENHDYDSVISFVRDINTVILTHSDAWHCMFALINLLSKALNNQLQLRDSVKEDIGFLYNQSNYYLWIWEEDKMLNNFQDQVRGGSSPIDHHCLWKNKEWVTWLYNDKSGKIVFEITPYYPYFFEVERRINYMTYADWIKSINYISYGDWIKNYKPYVITILSHERAEEWLKQAQDVVNQKMKTTIFY